MKTHKKNNIIGKINISKIVILLFFVINITSCKDSIGFSVDTKTVSADGSIKINIKNRDPEDKIVKAELFSYSDNIAFYNVAFKNSGKFTDDEITMQIIKGIETKSYSGLKLKITFEEDEGKSTDDSTKLEGFKTFSFSSILSIKDSTKSVMNYVGFDIDYNNSDK